jgi:hypothetical protein
MKKLNLLLLLTATFSFSALNIYAQDEAPARGEWQSPKVVTPGSFTPDCMQAPPSDAYVLFDGKDLSQFESADGSNAKWAVGDGVFTVKKGAGDIQTRRLFNDFQLHIEWRIPEDIQGTGQGRGNSGIYLQGRYEIQVLDSYNNETYFNGQAGSVYSQMPPLVNAMRKPGEWNVYDIIYTAPTFKTDGTFRTRPRVTILHNGVLVQNNTTILGITYKDYKGYPPGEAHGAGPILLQDHGFPVSYRNVWIREL